MFLVTNRKILRESGDCSILGKSPNVKGPNELRLVEATKRGKRWSLEVLPDKVDTAMRDAVGAKDRHVVSYVTGKLLARINPQFHNPKSKARGRSLLVFVHGFNNDVEDMLERSLRLSKNYGVEVLPFSWPANGGGVISGTASYKSDKRDAKASIGALDRILHALDVKLKEVTEEAAKKIPHAFRVGPRPHRPCGRLAAQCQPPTFGDRLHLAAHLVDDVGQGGRLQLDGRDAGLECGDLDQVVSQLPQSHRVVVDDAEEGHAFVR